MALSQREKNKNAAIKALRKAFSKSKYANDIKRDRRVPGARGIRGGPMQKCAYCGKLIPEYMCELDHDDPVVPLEISALSMTLDWYYKRLFCEEKNIVITCKPCHKKKSSEELTERKKWRKKIKWVVVRIKNGSLISVKKVIDMKDNILYNWDILDFFHTRKEADSDAKKRKKLKE